jgi:hypothetical protein
MESGKTRSGLGFVLAVYLGSRLFYLTAGLLFVGWLPISPFHTRTADDPFGTLNLWAHWDGEHYMRLARSGYLNEPDNVSPAFFPLYPLLIRSFAGLFGGPVDPGVLTLWGTLLSLLSLPAALFFVYRIAESGWGVRAARGAVLTLAFFPTAFFLNAAYTESLFLALSAGSLWAAMVRRDLLLACLLAGLATATRNVGVFLLAPLAYEWLAHFRHYRWRGVYLLLAPSGLLAYMSYLWWRFGEPLLFYTEQQDWNRAATGPLGTLTGAFGRSRESLAWLSDLQGLSGITAEQLLNHLARMSTVYGLVLLALAAVLLLVGLRILPPGLTAYAFLVAVVPAFFGSPENPLMGLPRYLLVAFPLFIVLGVLLKDRRLRAAWTSVSAAASLVLCALFVTWRFVA